ncbi:unnamed protein product [Phytomonas sp. Hart1]|nr:unnamed protein product [Phytomonas sp. Hart1]|eukprot:CCW68100.1 unnamed protein product [Phytomonas sp. isolate Hart1]
MLRSVRSRAKRKDEPRVLILGLDNAGKTTILNMLRQVAESPSATAPEGPTQGFNTMELTRDGVHLRLCDLGGQRSIREFWKDYYENTDCVAYVVDSSDIRRLEESCQTFQEVLESIPNVPVLVFANKQDLATSKTPEVIALALKLEEHRERKWQIQGCSAKTGDGLNEGFQWISSICIVNP